MYFKSERSLKDLYLSKRDVKEKYDQREIQRQFSSFDEVGPVYKGIHRGSQVVTDLKEFILKCYFDKAIRFYLYGVSNFIKKNNNRILLSELVSPSL